MGLGLRLKNPIKKIEKLVHKLFRDKWFDLAHFAKGQSPEAQMGQAKLLWPSFCLKNTCK